VGALLAGARPLWVLLLVLACAAVLWVRTLRWRILLRPLGEVPLQPALSATVIGFGAGGVLPFRLGELVRPALIARKTGMKMSAALSSVVLERLFDMLIVLACFLIVSFTQPVPAGMRRGALVVAVGLVIGLALLRAVQRNPARGERLVGRLARPLPPRLGHALQDLSRSFLAGLGALADTRTVLVVLAYSVYVWGAIALTFLFGLLALGIGVPPFSGALTIMVTVAAFVFLPQAPGFVGTWQAACVLALHDFYGVSKDLAVGYSLLTWIVSMGVNVGLAGLFLAREDLSLAQLVRAAGEVEAAAAVDETPAVGREQRR
jgi:glycosyltransferase 2 family protein